MFDGYVVIYHGGCNYTSAHVVSFIDDVLQVLMGIDPSFENGYIVADRPNEGISYYILPSGSYAEIRNVNITEV